LKIFEWIFEIRMNVFSKLFLSFRIIVKLFLFVPRRSLVLIIRFILRGCLSFWFLRVSSIRAVLSYIKD